MSNADLVLHVLSLVCFILAGLGITANGLPWGLALFMLSLIV